MKLTLPPTKNFKKDIEIICQSIKSENNFTISKFCDGELSVILNKPIDNKEFAFDPTNNIDQASRKLLLEAFQYKNSQYYVGITCTKVFGLNTHRQMKMISGQRESQLTWADIWVNSNYSYFTNNILPLFKNRRTILVCNESGNVNNLPFSPEITFRVQNSAMRNNMTTIDKIKNYIVENKVSNYIFLFCCGPFGNILSHKLTEFKQDNTYLDIGSTLNPYLQSEGFSRHYYSGDSFFSRLVGEWDNG